MSRKSKKRAAREKPRKEENFVAALGWWGRPRRVAFAIGLLLCVGVWLIFGRTLGFGFVDFDDPGNVSENPVVKAGLSPGGIVWAFTHPQVNSWVPLTTLSHMFDCQIHGMWAGGHHLTNVLLHAATSVLLFLALRGMTSSLWRSAFVAALFAFHPLRVESVAWITERKDVLSGLFFMLTLRVYARWVHEPERSRAWIVIFLALGLLSKAMLVTVPLVLLLLDHWPLRRTTRIPLRQRVIEKIPFILLCAAALVTQVLVARDPSENGEAIPVVARIANAVVSCALYVVQMVWPSQLAAFYPFPQHIHWLALIAALAFLGAVSWAAWRWRRQAPWLVVGWLWYLVMVFPVLGLVQAGEAARADRYTYLPHIGLYVAVTWLVGSWCSRERDHGRRILVGVVGCAVLVGAAFMAYRQTGYWKDSETLWRRAIACTDHNHVALYNLGTHRLNEGKLDQAISYYENTLEANPRHADAHINLGRALLQKGKPEEAVAQYEKALEARPHFAEAHYNLGLVLAQEKRMSEAIQHYEKALEIKPAYFDAQNNLGSALLQSGKLDEAIDHYQSALRVDPESVKAHNNLATALVQKGQVPEAVTHYQAVLKSDPNHIKAQAGLAWLLATSTDPAIRDNDKAVSLAERANQMAHEKDPLILRILAAAQAGAGRFENARQLAQRALDLATAPGQAQESLAAQLRGDLEQYKAGKTPAPPQ
jgi:Tfp pilus assembly protein PilF